MIKKRRIPGPGQYMLLLWAGLLCLFLACSSGATTKPTAAPQGVAPDKETQVSEYLTCFETVWQKINDTYFDPDFGGLDWQAVHDRYRPRIAGAEDDKAFYQAINEMLGELNVSHIGVIPADDAQQIEPVLSAPGSPGIDLRLVDGDAVITSVDPGSPADRARVRPGYTITSIDGETVEEIAAGVQPIPPLHERNERKRVTSAILAHILGASGEPVTIAYLDGRGARGEVDLDRIEREGRIVLDETMPPFFIEFEAKRLDGNIGYIRFNAFLPPVDRHFPEALASMSDAQGLVIDLRGNHGGIFPVRKGLAEQLVSERTLCWRYVGRDDTRDAYLEPATNVYTGPVIVLVDVLSASSAEEFAGAMQTLGRATIVGERTAGIVVTADFMQLPNGALFIYPTSQTLTADGTVLEGRGVIPDIPIALDRGQLLMGIDAQLEAAIQHLSGQSAP